MHVHIRISGITFFLTALAVLAAVALVAAGWVGYINLPGKFRDLFPTTTTTTTTSGKDGPVVVVMATEGGQLEIATFTKDETFTRADKKVFDPRIFDKIDLGTTISEVRLRATYRYHIKMEKAWPLTIDGMICIVKAGSVEATLPVAFDTATVEKRTESGWARFNKAENLEALERSLTQQLAERAPRHTAQAQEEGRRVVAAFVSTWLLQGPHWSRDPRRQIVVLFPGEPEPRSDIAQH